MAEMEVSSNAFSQGHLIRESCVWGQDESWQQEADDNDNDDDYDAMMRVRRVLYVDELPARPQSSRLWR